VTPRQKISLALLAGALASALSACGRKGPLELPAEYQVQESASKEQRDAKQRDQAAKGLQPAFDPNSPGAPPKPSDIPGTSGNRPPAQYPFPLDPIL
jgi:predicted small lipoprotein YifL